VVGRGVESFVVAEFRDTPEGLERFWANAWVQL